jgi:2-succinyl-5-enolpyruvyl-6-hydroxy-3-cyclohexene-1-carboxylate synthase
MGDLTFLHDSTGLVIGPAEPRPDLTLVVVNDDGGGLFTLLEQGEPRYVEEFERVFGTPHGVDLAALCLASGTPHRLVGSDDELRSELARAPSGIRVLEVGVDRGRTRNLHARLRAAVHDAVT